MSDGLDGALAVKSFVLYRILRSINAWYGLGLLWVCIVAFLLAAPLLFVFPQLTLLLLFIGLAGLGIAAMLARVLKSLQERFAQRSLRWGVCPSCGHATQQELNGTTIWRCDECGAAFEPDGAALPDVTEPSTIDHDNSLTP